MTSSSRLPTRWASAAGIVAAPFYLALIIVLGALEPGFSHRTSLMSILGGVPGWRGMMFNLGVAATGVLVVVVAVGLRRRLPSIVSSVIGIGLLAVGGLGLIGAGLFSCNESCRNILIEPDLTGRLHTVASLFRGLGCGLSLFFLWAAMRRSDVWNDVAGSTLATAILANVPGMVFWVTLLADMRLYSVEGLIQRVGFIVVLVWIFFIARRMRTMLD